jgi:hypothetical protein
MSDNTTPVDEKLEKVAQALSFEKFMAEHGKGLTKEQFTNIANVIPGTRATFPGFAAGFAQQPLIGTLLAPEIVAAPDGTEIASFPTFNKERFYSSENTVVAINSGRKTADSAVSWTTATLEANAIDVPVDIRMARAYAASNIDASIEAIELGRSQIELGKEKAIATLLRTQGNYDATGTNSFVSCSSTASWGNASATPIETILAAKETVRSKCGMYPNVFWLSPLALRYLSVNAEIKDVMKYGGTPSSPGLPATTVGLENLFGMSIVVGSSISNTTINGALSDVWGTDAGLLVVGNNNLHTPKFAATFVAAGSPKVMPAYLDRRFGAEGSMVYSYVDYYKAFITMNTAGYLFTTAGTTT